MRLSLLLLGVQRQVSIGGAPRAVRPMAVRPRAVRPRPPEGAAAAFGGVHLAAAFAEVIRSGQL